MGILSSLEPSHFELELEQVISFVKDAHAMTDGVLYRVLGHELGPAPVAIHTT